MLAIGEGNVVRRFTFKSISSDVRAYVFVDKGFYDLIWYPMLPFMILGHVIHFYGLYLIFTQNLWSTFITMSCFMLWAGFGVTAGSHRLWCHRSYEAKLPFRIFLMIGHTLSGQYSIVRWSAGHRTHHKYSDTDADPHNVKRGFSFSHLGWMVRKEHPLVDIKAVSVDVSDIESDPVAAFQHRNYGLLFLLISVILPVATPMILFNESLTNALIICFFMRLVTQTHDTAFVNSAAHMFGDRPYSQKIASTENSWVSFGAIGEGYHNYHHAFPYDYAAGETGNLLNPTKLLIDLMHKIGQADRLKQASPSLVNKSKQTASVNIENNNRQAKCLMQT